MVAPVGLAQRYELTEDEFLLYFETDGGVEVKALGLFLQRLSTATRKSGAEVRVVGVYSGSVAVKFSAFFKGEVVPAAKNEFLKAPIDTTIKVTTAVSAAVGAIIGATILSQSQPTPIAKTGATIIERGTTNIQVVTLDNSVVIMDEETAARIRFKEQEHKKYVALNRGVIRAHPDHPAIEYERSRAEGLFGSSNMRGLAKEGLLEGTIRLAGGVPYFQPDDFDFMVPVVTDGYEVDDQIEKDGRFRIQGEIIDRRGRPSAVVVQRIWPMPSRDAPVNRYLR